MTAVAPTFADRTIPGDAAMVSAAELRRNFGVWQERALSAPVVIVRHGRPRLVLSAAEEFFGQRHTEVRSTQALQSALVGAPEHMSEGLLVLDRELRITAVNRAFCEMAGRSAPDLLGRAWQDEFPAAADAPITIWLKNVLRTGAAVHLETTSAQEPSRHFLVTVYPHADGVAALLHNVTAERLMAEEVNEQRSLTEAMNLLPRVGHLQVNPRGLVCGASQGTLDLLGYDPSEPRRSLADIAATPHRDRLLKALDEVLSGGAARRVATALRTAEQDDVLVEMALAPIDRGRATAGATGFFHAALPARRIAEEPTFLADPDGKERAVTSSAPGL